MSLINEALKRAKEAQQPPSATPAGFPPLRAVEPAHTSSSSLLPAATLSLVAMLVLIVIWQWLHPRHVAARVAEASIPLPRTAAPMKPPFVPAKTPAVAPAKSPPQTVLAQAPALVVAANPPGAHPATPAPAPAVTPPPAPAAALAKPVTNPPAAPAEPAPKTPPLNVQAIVFNPSRPSALINGRTLFLGDHISDFRVAAISHRTVTLVKPGKTNVLILRD